MDDFKKDRIEAMMSLDPAKVRAFGKKYDAELPGDDGTLLISIHKARTAMTDIPMEARRVSKAWLRERGYEAWDDGDV